MFNAIQFAEMAEAACEHDCDPGLSLGQVTLDGRHVLACGELASGGLPRIRHQGCMKMSDNATEPERVTR
jgi:hypothetical protein